MAECYVPMVYTYYTAFRAKWCMSEQIVVSEQLTHWGRVMHICRAIIWTNAGILLIGILGTNVSEIWREIRIFSFKKMYLKTLSVKWWPFCLSLNALNKPNLIFPWWLWPSTDTMSQPTMMHYWPFVRGIHWSSLINGDWWIPLSPHQLRGALMSFVFVAGC